MANNRKIFIIDKISRYEGNFTQIDTKQLGIAAGKLTFAGFKLYTFLMSNQSGYRYEFSPVIFAQWLGEEKYTDENGKIIKEKDSIRKKVDKCYKAGFEDLVANNYIEEESPGVFRIYEIYEDLEQKVPNLSLENITEQKVPKKEENNELGTKSSEKDVAEQKVPNLIETFGF